MAAGVRPVKASLNETMTLAATAARGAGAPPAQAISFGHAALRHLAAHRPAQDLTRALHALPDGPILTLPLIFLHLQANPRTGVPLPPDVPDTLLQSYAEAQPFAIALRRTRFGPRMTSDPATPAAVPEVSRIDLPDDLYRLLREHADRVLVPENDRSRRQGAGAGLSDND
ncbi:hypothetical protein [Sulfitobacter sp. THAF37]|uniref:hypothetical protein n=1 Tax=Sulfitobacter sp. THAF37 TaxID=2587855 RepID=UPI0012693329|nr:hypothetical protein [Sulfitobacter sp. THAF37]